MSDRYLRPYEKLGQVKSDLATGTVFLFVGVLSIVMNAASIDFIGLRFWGAFLFIPAFFIMLDGISKFSRGKAIRNDVLMVIKSRGSGRYTIDEIAADAGVKRKHLLRVLFDLRSEGQILYRYDSHTGEIILGEGHAYEQAPGYVPQGNAAVPAASQEPATIQAQPQAEAPAAVDRKFCVFCGQKLDAGARYCPNCGSSLD